MIYTFYISTYAQKAKCLQPPTEGYKNQELAECRAGTAHTGVSLQLMGVLTCSVLIGTMGGAPPPEGTCAQQLSKGAKWLWPSQFEGLSPGQSEGLLPGQSEGLLPGRQRQLSRPAPRSFCNAICMYTRRSCETCVIGERGAGP